ncbi:hypothetical protein MVEN_01393200 [Mycena venus]|uniref:Uncharacterized protein n=1 Tax=Mycena venus TaxID=2733690 RepID=A0A8H6XYJ4_9AGAR|nr:hypothetical protein MVEN_01393200 [Mycena venus]
MAGENHRQQSTTTSRGSNGQRPAAAPRGGRKSKNATMSSTQVDLQEQLTRARAEPEAANKKLNEAAARGGGGADPAGDNREQVERLHRPKGEAGDSKNGFILLDAMGLANDRDLYEDILRHIHTNVARANLDYTVDFRRQDPGKLAAVYKLTRKEFPYLTRARFPLDWALAEMVKQYLRNKRRYAVKRGFIANRETRKRQREEDSVSNSQTKRRRVAGNVGHIDDEDEQDEQDEQDEEEQAEG